MAHGGLERSSRGPAGSGPLLPMCAERIGATRQTVIAIEQAGTHRPSRWPSGSPACSAFGSTTYPSTRTLRR